jgi:hypothetical protein
LRNETLNPGVGVKADIREFFIGKISLAFNDTNFLSELAQFFLPKIDRFILLVTIKERIMRCEQLMLTLLDMFLTIISVYIVVPDPGKGVCTDPVNRCAILEGEGLGPPSGDKERQLSPDRETGKT